MLKSNKKYLKEDSIDDCSTVRNNVKENVIER